MRARSLCLLAATLVVLAAAASAATPVAHIGAWGLSFEDRDPTVRPGDDFYAAQNGGWLARTQIGPQQPNQAYWRDLRRNPPLQVAAILRDLAARPKLPPRSPAGQAVAYWRAYLDDARVQARGTAPLRPQLDALRAATTPTALAHWMGELAGPGRNRTVNFYARPLGLALFGVDIVPDPDAPARRSVALSQAGLLLPGPEYYQDAQFADLRAAYLRYATAMLQRLDWPEAAQRAQDILAFETRVAAVSWSHERLADPAVTHHPMRVAALQAFAPGFDWRAFLDGAGLAGAQDVRLDADSAFPALAALFAATPAPVLQAREALALIDAEADLLDDATLALHFDFRTRQVNGQGGAAPPPREQRAVASLATHLDTVVGALYAQQHFSAPARRAALDMTGNLRRAFDARLRRVNWMSAPTRAEARAKLAHLRLHVGYPDSPASVDGLLLDAGDLYADAHAAAAWKWRRAVASLDRRVRDEDWSVTADYPNYAYVVDTNTLEIPAALLQPPFFDAAADPAVNYGAIGSLIGQMLAATLDPQGRRYDAQGRRRDWWTAREQAHFDAEAARLAAQYSAVEPLPGVPVQGTLVLDESLDDLGGLLIALDGYRLSLHGASAPLRDGLSGEQRFFLARAQMWRAKFGDAFVRNQLATGANAPPFLRVNGPLRNMDAWYAAFDVGPDARLYLPPAQRVRLW